jgi:hypothetical protein
MPSGSSARGMAGSSGRSSAISPNRAVSNIEGSHFGNSSMGSSRFGSSGTLAGTSRVVGGSRGFTGGIGASHTLGSGFGGSSTGFHGDVSNGFHGGPMTTGFHGGMTNGFHGATFNNGFNKGFNHGFGFHDGFHHFHGCFNCGFHFFFGFGFGFGWGPWWGPWGFWGPVWAPPPTYSDAAADNTSSSTSSGDYFPRPSFGGSLDVQGGEQGNSNPNSVTGNVAQSTPTVLLYLKDGTMYAASDYWLVDNKLHYRANYGAESAVNLDEVDLQRTVDENARRGVRFTLKPNPNGPTAAPAPSPNGGQPNGTASSNLSSESGKNHDGATPATNPAPERVPAPQAQETSQSQA